MNILKKSHLTTRQSLLKTDLVRLMGQSPEVKEWIPEIISRLDHLGSYVIWRKLFKFPILQFRKNTVFESFDKRVRTMFIT